MNMENRSVPQHREVHNADGDLRCPVEGCNAAGSGLIELTGESGRTESNFECYRRHR